MGLQGLHHVAYRCVDAQETAEFYTRFLDLDFSIAVAENEVPSTGEFAPHIHIFFRMEDGSFIAFFELPEAEPMRLDPNTPDWVQHLALKVADRKTLLAYKQKLTDGGVDVIGPTDHKICQSIYFFDPNGHRLELTVDTASAELSALLAGKADATLETWSRTRRAPDVDANLHRRARQPS